MIKEDSSDNYPLDLSLKSQVIPHPLKSHSSIVTIISKFTITKVALCISIKRCDTLDFLHQLSAHIEF